eukprot:Hpha_TRINITY_DN16497_c0_g1::TRINITY_DN16497_c0_g1_i1::g.161103::m.161103
MLAAVGLLTATLGADSLVVSGDYEAKVTFTVGGLDYKGTVLADKSGRRFFKYIEGLEEYTYVYQIPGKYVTFTYTNNTAGCDCMSTRDGYVSPWERLADAADEGECDKGRLYRWKGSNYLANDFLACITPEGTPVYTEEGTLRTTYHSFTDVRPDFPTPDLLSCQKSCNAHPHDKVVRTGASFNATHHHHKSAPTPPTVPLDFSAEVTFIQGGLKYPGRVMHDGSGRRHFKYTSGLEEYTYVYQVPEKSVTQTYTNNTAGCSCLSNSASEVRDGFPQLSQAIKAGSCDGGGEDSGTLWIGQVHNLVNVKQQKICLAADGVPLWTEQPGLRVEYHSFTAGRPSFPDVDLLSCQAACNQAADSATSAPPAHPAASGSESTLFGGDLTKIADFSADVTFVQAGLKYKGRLAVDSTGKRSFAYMSGLEQYTYRLQAPGVAASYVYTNLTSGCVCSNAYDTLQGDYWAHVPNSYYVGSCGTSKGAGDLWRNENRNLVGVGSFQVCFDSDGKPLYTEKGTSRIEFDTFTTGRPDFPEADLTSCRAGCVHL